MNKKDTIKIMIIDDEKDIRQTFKELFSHTYFHVFTAENGQKAVTEMLNQKYDIAFIDICMPVMDGIETLIELKKINPDLNTIMISGYSSEDVLEKSIKLGANFYLYKPLDIQNIIGVTMKCAKKLGIDSDVEIIK